jgi:hypothetical protein
VTLRVREPTEAAPEPPKTKPIVGKQKRPAPPSMVPKRKPAAPGTKGAKKKQDFIVGDDEGAEPEEVTGENEEEEYKELVHAVPLAFFPLSLLSS